MVHDPIDTREFLEVVRRPLADADAPALARAVNARWTCRQICRLLKHTDVDIRRVAAVTIGMIGDKRSVNCLARALHDHDPQVNEMAEHSLWSIWFRGGSPEATRPFSDGVQALAAEHYDEAIHHFERAALIDPNYAEAFNQCAIAHFFLGQWRAGIDDCLRAVDRMPVHFGAIAGMGHCYTQLGLMEKALACYKHAHRINPRLHAISIAIDRLTTILERQCDSSGIYDAATIQ
jgi:tetratricopeptide (TPR) repeat protein